MVGLYTYVEEDDEESLYLFYVRRKVSERMTTTIVRGSRNSSRVVRRRVNYNEN